MSHGLAGLGLGVACFPGSVAGEEKKRRGGGGEEFRGLMDQPTGSSSWTSFLVLPGHYQGRTRDGATKVKRE